MAEKTKTIGIIGGGQLGLMIVEQAHLLGARTLCLDPAPDAPAFALSDGHIVAAYDDAAALEELCRRSDVVTYEFENVPGSVLIPLEKKYNIPQGFRPLYDSQDRLREKDNARANGLRTPLYAAVDDEASLRAALAEIGFPAVLKTRTLGYDGHGQLVLKDEADVSRALPMLSVPCILEAFVPFDFEASIVMVSDGERVIHFPIGRNVHRDGILDLCFVPAEGMDDGLRSRMAAAGERFMKSCRYRSGREGRRRKPPGCPCPPLRQDREPSEAQDGAYHLRRDGRRGIRCCVGRQIRKISANEITWKTTGFLLRNIPVSGSRPTACAGS